MATSVISRRTADRTPAGPAPGPRGGQARRVLASVSGVVALVLVWFAASAGGLLNPSSVPSPQSVSVALLRELGASTFWSALGSTLLGWGLGLVIGSAAGLLLGSLIGLSRVLQVSTAATVEFLKTVPIIAVLPLAVLVLGTTLTMKVALVAFGVTWPLLVQTLYGVRSMDPVIRDTATSLGVGQLRRFLTVVLPSASPFIATGLRVAASGGLVLTIVVELIAGGRGLGVLISTAAVSGAQALPAMYARIIVAGLLGFAVASVLTALERRGLRWHESHRPVSS